MIRFLEWISELYLVEMAISLRDAKERVASQSPIILEHWIKTQLFPNSRDIFHWRTEIRASFRRVNSFKVRVGRMRYPTKKEKIEWLTRFSFEVDQHTIDLYVKDVLLDYDKKSDVKLLLVDFIKFLDDNLE